MHFDGTTNKTFRSSVLWPAQEQIKQIPPDGHMPSHHSWQDTLT